MKSTRNRRRRRSSSEDRRPRRYRSVSRSPVKRSVSRSPVNRRTHGSSSVRTKDKKAPPVHAVLQYPPKKAQRVGDLIHHPEKLIEHLFRSVPRAALWDMTPDDLKERPTEQLKELCLLQLRHMSEGLVRHLISGGDPSLYEEMPECEKASPQTSESNSPYELPTETDQNPMQSAAMKLLSGRLSTRCSNLPSPAHCSALEPRENVGGDENLVPEEDPELLELEMRARAIRSLLRAKTRRTPE